MVIWPADVLRHVPLCMRYRVRSTCHWVYHNHAGVELHHCESGEGVYQVAGMRWCMPHSAVTLLHGPSMHQVSIQGNPHYECTVLEFLPSLLETHGTIFSNELHHILPNQAMPIVQFILSADDHLKLDMLLQSINSESYQRDPYRSLAIVTYLMQILILLARAQQVTSGDERVSAHERLLIGEVVAKVDEWLDNAFSIEDIARHFGISSSYLRRVFRKVSGVGLGWFIADRRFGSAYMMLCRGYSITQAAIESGYQDVSSLTRAFKKKTNITPSEFVRQYRQKAGGAHVQIS